MTALLSLFCADAALLAGGVNRETPPQAFAGGAHLGLAADPRRLPNDADRKFASNPGLIAVSGRPPSSNSARAA